MEEGRIGGGRKSMSHAAKDSHAWSWRNLGARNLKTAWACSPTINFFHFRLSLGR